MCSRQVFSAANEIAEAFGIQDTNDRVALTNAAPTDSTPIISLQQPQILQYFKWGFPWVGNDERSRLTTCVRSETALIKFKHLFNKKNRALSISNGFFEFSKTHKTPYYFKAKDQPYTIIAALWDKTMDIKTGNYENRYAILTVEPNDLVANTHDRMPVILTPAAQKIWMDENSSFEQLKELFLAYSEDNMEVKIADKSVNNAKNKNFKLEGLKNPSENPEPPTQGSLF